MNTKKGLRIVLKTAIIIVLGFVLTILSTNLSSPHLYAFGAECHDASRLLGRTWCIDVTEIYGFPLGFVPKIPGSIGSGYEDMNELFYEWRFLFDLAFYSLVVYLISDIITKTKVAASKKK